MKTCAFALLVASVSAFAPPAFVTEAPSSPIISLAMVVDDDFDAPLERAVAVGNIVLRPEDRVVNVGPLKVPKFLARIFNLDDRGAIADFDSLAGLDDDECYLGKDGDLDDCVDFDP